MTAPLPCCLPLYFIRHGETDWNAAGLVMGRQEIPLNALGHEQSRQAAAIAAKLGLASLWTSPLVRARETAAVIGEAVGLAPTVVDGLAERCWGVYEGGPERLRLGPDHEPPEGESFAVFEARVLAGLAEIRGPAPAMLVAHSGVFRVMLRRLGLAEPKPRIGNGVPVRFDEKGLARV